MKKVLVYLILSTLLIACSSGKYRLLEKQVNTKLYSPSFENQFVGLLVYDPEKKDTLYRYNSEKYFTPASNTKIFTLYTALKLLPNRIPALKYVVQNDTLFIEGTGDPSLLHPYFKDSTVIHFLESSDHIVLNQPFVHTEHFGPGWAWEDYDSYYSTERSAFPLYGNVVRLFQKDSMVVSPAYFKESVIQLDYLRNRDLYKNTFYFNPLRNDTLEIPFITGDTLVTRLLEEITGKKIHIDSRRLAKEKQILYGMSSDTLYKRMMYESDNFLAEQLLLLASSTLSDTLDGSKAQDYTLKSYLSDLKQSPKWVDGSGLSRYNLFSPASMVHVLNKMYTEIPRERLFDLFPLGGVSGTMKTWDNSVSEPYLYAKSGSLGNNYCLSGYLITKRGKTLIFSFMNNHFKNPTSEIKTRMQEILGMIRDEN